MAGCKYLLNCGLHPEVTPEPNGPKSLEPGERELDIFPGSLRHDDAGRPLQVQPLPISCLRFMVRRWSTLDVLGASVS